MIDEKAIRLWLINDAPRSWYPIFMEQRRDRLRELSETNRMRWLWLGILRLMPLAAAMSYGTDRADDLFSMVFRASGKPEIDSVIRNTKSTLEAVMAPPSQFRRDLTIDNLAYFLLQAVDAAIQGQASSSLNMMAYALERVFDSLYTLDRQFNGDSFSLAKREDEAWLSDAIELRDDVARQGQIIERSRDAVAELRAFCRRPEVGSLINR